MKKMMYCSNMEWNATMEEGGNAMKEYFDDCVIELICFEAKDVITESDPGDCTTKACIKSWEG